MVYGHFSRTRVFTLVAVFLAACCVFTARAWGLDSLPFCDPMAGLLSDDFTPTRLSEISTATEAARAKAETSPFANACQDPKLFKDRPPTGLFRRAAPLTDSKGHSSTELLKRIGARVLSSMSDEELRLSVFDDCLSGKMQKSSPACLDVRKKIDAEILPMVHSARMNLALAQTTGQIQTAAFEKASLTANESLSSLGTHKETSWQPLVANETKNAKTILEEYLSESKTEAARQVTAGKLAKKDVASFVNDAVLSSRFTHGLTYIETLSHNPILQYLKSAKPSDQEIMQAVQKMRKNLAHDRAYAEKALRAANETSSYASYRGVRYKNGPLTELNSDALPILDFTSHVESALQETPEFCGLAASLQYTKENRAIGNGLAIGIPLVVVSFALPIAGQAMAGAALGAIGGAGFVVQSKFDRDLAANRFISKLEVDSNEDYEKLDRADRDYKISWALGPIAAIAGPGARVAVVGLRATRFGAWLTLKTIKSGKLVETAAEAAAKTSGAGK